jgi:NTP pyrophosphatase (non-canonical NTP hydrolase)
MTTPMGEKKISTIRDAQELVRFFAKRNGWKDVPNIDKFDHLHEELLEMSQHLRYKSEKERKKTAKENKNIFVDGVGDLFFGLCRLANQLDVDVEDAFNIVKKEIFSKYRRNKKENNLIKNKR